MREIVLDTETTGFKPEEGHRLVEIGCVELMHRVPTGRTYHTYINPERAMPEGAFKVHGLSEDFLKDKPLFHTIADHFLAFICNDPLIIHNASFDMRFLNAELKAAQKETLPYQRAVDTLLLARRKFPGSPASLDALCRRFGIDNSRREKHGALLDSELLAEVYLELTGGRQRTFDILTSPNANQPGQQKPAQKTQGLSKSLGEAGHNNPLTLNKKTQTGIDNREKRKETGQIEATGTPSQRSFATYEISQEERAAHNAFLKKLTNAMWLRS